MSERGPEGTPDPERQLSHLLHDLRTPLNQIIGLSEMLIEIADEEAHPDIAAGLGAVRDGGLALASMLQGKEAFAIGCPSEQDYESISEATRDLQEQMLGFVEKALADSSDARLAIYEDDLKLIRTAVRNFEEAARTCPLFIRRSGTRISDLSGPSDVGGSRTAGPSLEGGRILIVDDERLNREVLVKRLRREGCEPVEAESAIEALKLLRRERFNVILLDIQMPEMSGIEMLQVLKNDAELRQIPVIMLSALTDVDHVARCIELGAEDYLPKPINAVLLRARLGACLEKQRLRAIEEAQAEELVRASKLQSVGLLAGGLAHDFNNMLTAVLGNLSLLRHRENLSTEMLAAVSEAERGALRAQELTRYLLTFAEGGAPIKEAVHARKLIQETGSFVLRGSNVHCDFQLSENLWDLLADPRQLGQMLGAVIINAVEATPEGGNIVVRAKNAPNVSRLPAGDYVTITVQDFGTGIAPEHLNRVFDPFFTTKKQARGLGLAASYSIVQRHGGYIGIESARGTGTTVTIHLPAVRVEAPEPVTVSTGGETGEEEGRGHLRVLVMDDEEAIRMLIEAVLGMAGHEVVSTVDGDAFLAAHAAALAVGKPFDLAIMDLTIPGGMGGKEAIRRLRERDTTIRAIVSSGYSNDPIMSRCAAYGFDAVLPKPYVVMDLMRAVAQFAPPAEG